MLDAIGLLLLLFGLEIVLGVDNILVIAIFISKLSPEQRKKARFFGLLFALIARIVFICVLIKLADFRHPIAFGLSIRDMILIAGGLFLLYKAVAEIHSTVELKEEKDHEAQSYNLSSKFASVISQIVILDIVFSIDSVITAIGLTNNTWIIVTAVILSFIAILYFAGPIGEFIIRHTSIKILALAFLVTIGVTIFMEGIHKSLPREYIYLPMGFALMVEFLKMRYDYNKKRKFQKE
ncbi:MAG TPA: hypothetical protein DD381_06535 [Lentisphaeria bacterium]|nr:MAG: hypothetical protein A2X47_13245 [Lentisphaerae bacterium GWF2_38_69]HBM15982.1 hypothetical protein [Lentisphaeria bacterium]